jgi:hypothetical protein
MVVPPSLAFPHCPDKEGRVRSWLQWEESSKNLAVGDKPALTGMDNVSATDLWVEAYPDPSREVAGGLK